MTPEMYTTKCPHCGEAVVIEEKTSYSGIGDQGSGSGKTSMIILRKPYDHYYLKDPKTSTGE